MRRQALLFCLLAGLGVPSARANSRLQAATTQGQLLAETVRASIAAANALLAQGHPHPHANTFFALRQGAHWLVYFGWIEKDGSRFTPALVLTAPRGKLEQMHLVDAPKAPSNLLADARVVSVSRSLAAKLTGNPHVDPVLVPTPTGLDVYVMQGGPMRDAVLLGGDFLFHFDAGGKRLLSRIQFHKGILRVPRADPKLPASKTVGSYHTHVVDEEPTATDVAAAILHPELTPMFVIGRSGAAYRVDSTGAIHPEPRFAALRDVPLAANDGGVTLIPADALPASAR